MTIAMLQTASGLLTRRHLLHPGRRRRAVHRDVLHAPRAGGGDGDIDRQRRELMDQLGKEHEAVLGNVDGQRVATLAELDRKIERALLGAEGIRARALGDLDAT